MYRPKYLTHVREVQEEFSPKAKSELLKMYANTFLSSQNATMCKFEAKFVT